MWWEEQSDLDKTRYSPEAVDRARVYLEKELGDALPKVIEKVRGRDRNDFLVNWFSQGLSPLASMTHLGLTIQALDEAMYPDDKPKLQKKIRSLVRLRDNQLQSLYAEFFFGKYLVRRFAPIRLEPSIPGTARKADFLVHYDGQPVVFDVSRLVIQELVEWLSLQRQVVEAIGRMAVKGNLYIEVSAVFDFVPRATETDELVAALRRGLQELIRSGGNNSTVELDDKRQVRLQASHLTEVKEGDETWVQGESGRILRRGRVGLTKGYLAWAPSIRADILARLLGSRLRAKIDRTARDKLQQGQRGKPFVLVLNLDSVPDVDKNLELVHDMIIDTVRRHQRLSAVLLFQIGTPFYKLGDPGKWDFVFDDEGKDAALLRSFIGYFFRTFQPLETATSS